MRGEGGSGRGKKKKGGRSVKLKVWSYEKRQRCGDEQPGELSSERATGATKRLMLLGWVSDRPLVIVEGAYYRGRKRRVKIRDNVRPSPT